MEKKILKLSILCVFLLFLSGAKSQIVPENPKHKLDPYRIGYVGKWLWQEGEDSLELLFKLKTIGDLPSGLRVQVIAGYHKLVCNGEVLENSMGNFKIGEYNLDMEDGTTITGSTGANSWATFFMTHKGKVVELLIQNVDPNHLYIISVHNTPGLKVNTPGRKYDASIDLPAEVTLTRQELPFPKEELLKEVPIFTK